MVDWNRMNGAGPRLDDEGLIEIKAPEAPKGSSLCMFYGGESSSSKTCKEGSYMWDHISEWAMPHNENGETFWHVYERIEFSNDFVWTGEKLDIIEVTRRMKGDEVKSDMSNWGVTL